MQAEDEPDLTYDRLIKEIDEAEYHKFTAGSYQDALTAGREVGYYGLSPAEIIRELADKIRTLLGPEEGSESPNSAREWS